jgi:2-polyprenyl-3-methyl-5-hydroxy-6-metoxy-1,4-benzoquinol methylase
MKTRCQGLDVYKCTDCSLTFTWPLLSGQEEDTGNENSSITEQAFYDGLLKSHDTQSQIAQKKAPLMLEEYSKIIGHKPLSILEIGCGTGQYSDAWNNLDVKWLGVEVNKSMLDFCQHKKKNVVTHNDFFKSNEYFDVIFLSQVLEHILEPEKFLNNLFSRLNKKGVLHIDVPNHDGLIPSIRKINPISSDYGFIQPNHHLIAYNQKSLSKVSVHALY